MPLLALLVLPIIEIAFLIRVGSALGVINTIVLLFCAGFAGMAVLRWQGFGMLLRVQQKMASGEPPAEELLEGGLLALAGVLLILPGFVSDLIALLILVPGLRRWWVRRWIARRVFVSDIYQTHHASGGRTIDGEWERKQPDDKQLR